MPRLTPMLRRHTGIAAALLAGVISVGVTAAPAPAAPPAGQAASGTEIQVDATNPLRPLVVLTNRSGATCRVATTAAGTITILAADQGGARIAPVPVGVGFPERLDYTIVAGLRPLEPGASARISLRTLPGGPTGHAIESVSADGEFGSIYPVQAGRPLALGVGYAVLADPGDGPPLCAPAATEVPGASPTGAAGSGSPRGITGTGRWLVTGAAVLVLLIMVTSLLLWWRRHRRDAPKGTPPTSGTAPAAVVALLALAAGTGFFAALAPARTAFADVTADDPSLTQAWNDCSGVLHQPGNDPGNIMPYIDGPDVHIHLIVPDDGVTGEDTKIGNNIFIYWNKDDHHKYVGHGGNADPCTSLYHEFYHAWEDGHGGQDTSPCVTASGASPIHVNEVNATRVQNKLREKLFGPDAVRDHYGYDPLPDGPCLPKDQQPKPPQCTGKSCASDNGDPHLTTYDHHRYDFQAVGEFVATRDPAGGYEIQVRQQPAFALTSRVASVTTAVAIDVAGDRVEVRDDAGVSLLVNAEPQPLGTIGLAHGGRIATSTGPTGPILTVTWPDSSVAIIDPIGKWGLRLDIGPSAAHAGKLVGLLGDFDGNPDNDIRPRGGSPIAQPTFDDLYRSYADSWRIDAKTALFTYLPGTSTQTYTDRTFPDRPVNPADIPNRAAATSVCQQAGVSDPDVLADCVLDVGLTGRSEFALSAAATQTVTAPVSAAGIDVTLTVSQPGGTARFEFPGTAGEKIFVNVSSSTVPDSCGSLKLERPDGQNLAGGCILSGNGFIDGTVLPTTGTYTLELAPGPGKAGTATARIIPVTDQHGTIAPDGPVVTSTVAQPGGVSQFTFTAVAGEKVFVDAPSSSLPDQCGSLKLFAPDGHGLTSGCVIGGNGFIDGTDLTATGLYTLEVDPANRTTGQTQLRLVVDHDQSGTVAMNGAAVRASIGQPGAVARFTFTGVKGQHVYVDAAAATLPDQCGLLTLRGPAGDSITSGCIIDGKGNIGASGAILPSSGTYVVVLDPSNRATGEVTLLLHT